MSMAEACALAGQHDSEPRTEHPDGRRRDHRAIRETWSPKTGPWILGILRSTSVGEQAGRGGTDHRARAGGGWGIADVWRCHCGPERTHSRSVHWLRPVEGRFVPVPATKSRLWLLCYGTQTPVHPLHCADVLRFSGAWKGLPSAPPPHEGLCAPFARTIDDAHLHRQASRPGCAQADSGGRGRG